MTRENENNQDQYVKREKMTRSRKTKEVAEQEGTSRKTRERKPRTQSRTTTRASRGTRTTATSRATGMGRASGATRTSTASKVSRTTSRRTTRTQTASKEESTLPIQIGEQSIAKQTSNNIFKKPTLKIIPLGGLHEVGKNITVFEYGDEIIIVDCGISFPEDDMLGIDLVIPDVTYLERNKEKIKGMVITHGHEDHIGSIPYFLKQINVPIYATKLTVGLIKNKLEEHKLVRSTKLIEITPGQKITLGDNFKVEFIRSTHSIPDSVMLAITTPVGTVLHTGDFKVDYTPIDGKIMDLGRIAELGNQGIIALMSDSTNAERKGFTMSESSVGEVLDKLFIHCTKRIVVATFASNVHRVQQIVNSAVKNNRKIAVCGRSMINMITTARELGYIECP